jgi:hypothetical protein
MANPVRISFLENGITLTQRRLGSATNVPAPGSWEATVWYDLVIQKLQLRMELFGRAENRAIIVGSMPLWLYYLFDQRVAHRRRWDPATQEYMICISIRTIEHAEDIEVPALQWIFRQMDGVNNCVPAHDSIGQAILLYRALQLLHLTEAAAGLREQLLIEIKQKPLTAYDVQRIWWAFEGSREWQEWLGEIFSNLVRHNILEDSREGTDILYFFESEMLQMSQDRQNWIEEIYHLYMNPRPRPRQGIKTRVAFAMGLGRLTRAPSQVAVKREREVIE